MSNVNKVIADITANATEEWTPNSRGAHTIFLTGTFASSTVVLKQHGVTLKDVTGANVSATASAKFVVDGLVDDVPVQAVQSGGSGSSHVAVYAYKLAPGDLVAPPVVNVSATVNIAEVVVPPGD